MTTGGYGSPSVYSGFTQSTARSGSSDVSGPGTSVSRSGTNTGSGSISGPGTSGSDSGRSGLNTGSGSISGPANTGGSGNPASHSGSVTAYERLNPYQNVTTPTSVPGFSRTYGMASDIQSPAPVPFRYVAPVSGFFIGGGASMFGARRGRFGRLHAGADWQAPNGSPAMAIIGGTVSAVGYDGAKGGYGHYAIIIGDDGNAYRYATHGPLSVQIDQRVEQGEKVGTIAAGHLHFEVIPPDSPAFKSMKAGQKTSTQWYRGGKPLTVDQEKFFGAKRGLKVAAGQPFDGKGEIDPNAKYAIGDPFGVAASKSGGGVRKPNLRPTAVAAAAVETGTDPLAYAPADAATTPKAVAAAEALAGETPTLASLGQRVLDQSRSARKGDSGPHVRELQTFLNNNGFTDNKGRQLAVDGDFGGLTKQAVKSYQNWTAIHVDGVVGPETLQAMLADTMPEAAVLPGEVAYRQGADAATVLIDPNKAYVDNVARGPIAESRTRFDDEAPAEPPVETAATEPGKRERTPSHSEEREYDPFRMADATIRRRWADRQAKWDAREKVEAAADKAKTTPGTLRTLSKVKADAGNSVISGERSANQRFYNSGPIVIDRFRPPGNLIRPAPLGVRDAEAVREFARGIADSYRAVLEQRRLGLFSLSELSGIMINDDAGTQMEANAFSG